MEPEPDLATLLAAGEQAVFHGAPASAISSLDGAIEVAKRHDQPAEIAAATWLLGVAQSATGRYGAALDLLVPLLEAGEGAGLDGTGAAARARSAVGPELRLFGALAAATAASVHRGIGRHAAARDIDARGLALTDGPGEAAFDCVLGLTTDAVGAGDPAEATTWLEQAETMVEAHGGGWWRQRVRLDWARAELALLDDRAREAITIAAGAVAGAEAARAPRHVAKGLLLQGVAELQSGMAESVGTLRRSASLADRLGAVPIVWQARSLVGALIGGEDSAEGARSLADSRSAVLAIAADLPPDLRADWLARPNVSALLVG